MIFLWSLAFAHDMAQLVMFVDALRSEQTLWGRHYALWCVTQRNIESRYVNTSSSQD
jgi:hypothetical protein